MARPTSKADLIAAAGSGYEKLQELIASMTEKELQMPFVFGEEKKEAHWKRDKNLRDVLIHLYEWHQLLLDWVTSNLRGEDKPFIPKPYNWKNYGQLNQFFWEKHQNTSLEEAKKLLKESHGAVLTLAEQYTNEELFTRGIYGWTGNNALGSYFVSTLSSHYDWAMKKLKAHRKNCREDQMFAKLPRL